MRPSAAVSTLLLVACLLAGGLLAATLQMSGSPPYLVAASGLGGLCLGALLASSVKVVAQWERMIILRLGKFQGVADPGLRLLFPVFDTAMFVEMRVQTVPIAQQQAITQDNVPVVVNGVIFFKVVDAQKALMDVQDYRSAIWRLAQ